MRGQRLVQGRCNGEVVYRARTAAVCANGSINHHYSTEPPQWSSGESGKGRIGSTEGNKVDVLVVGTGSEAEKEDDQEVARDQHRGREFNNKMAHFKGLENGGRANVWEREDEKD